MSIRVAIVLLLNSGSPDDVVTFMDSHTVGLPHDDLLSAGVGFIGVIILLAELGFGRKKAIWDIENQQVVLGRSGTWTSAVEVSEFKMDPMIGKSHHGSGITRMLLEMIDNGEAKTIPIERTTSSSLSVGLSIRICMADSALTALDAEEVM